MPSPLRAMQIHGCLQLVDIVITGGCAQVVFARGHWKAPVWQGRFANMAQAGSDDDSLLVTWFLLEKPQPPGQAANLAATADGEHLSILGEVCFAVQEGLPSACITRVAVSCHRRWITVSQSTDY